MFLVPIAVCTPILVLLPSTRRHGALSYAPAGKNTIGDTAKLLRKDWARSDSAPRPLEIVAPLSGSRFSAWNESGRVIDT